MWTGVELPPVSVAVPVHHSHPGLAHALACLKAQTHRALEILIVLNGPEAPSPGDLEPLTRGDARIRTDVLPRAGLSGALNHALRAARHELVARMDADDACHVSRLEHQAQYLAAHASVAALGTAYAGVEPDGRRIGVERPPTDPREVRWRLLLGNCLCHGSMMLRRSPVLAAGGYDESLRKAQDYDLWLRLSRRHDIANLSEVLYEYRTSRFKRDEEQAATASRLMLDAWRLLPPADEATRARLESLLARATWGGHQARAALRRLEALLTEDGPSAEGMQAWWWIAHRAGHLEPDLTQAWHRHRLRAVARRLRHAGVRSLWLYGAGQHCGWILDHQDELGIPIAGVADDRLAHSRRHGFDIVHPRDIPPGTHVLLASEVYERQMWHARAPLRARGITVWRAGWRLPRPASHADPPPVGTGERTQAYIARRYTPQGGTRSAMSGPA